MRGQAHSNRLSDVESAVSFHLPPSNPPPLTPPSGFVQQRYISSLPRSSSLTVKRSYILPKAKSFSRIPCLWRATRRGPNRKFVLFMFRPLKGSRGVLDKQLTEAFVPRSTYSQLHYLTSSQDALTLSILVSDCFGVAFA